MSHCWEEVCKDVKRTPELRNKCLEEKRAQICNCCKSISNMDCSIYMNNGSQLLQFNPCKDQKVPVPIMRPRCWNSCAQTANDALSTACSSQQMKGICGCCRSNPIQMSDRPCKEACANTCIQNVCGQIPLNKCALNLRRRSRLCSCCPAGSGQCTFGGISVCTPPTDEEKKALM